MEKAKVYFSDLRALPGTSLPEKLKKLIRRAGIGEIDFEKKMTAIKIHFGEPGNLSYLRPNWAKAVADAGKMRWSTSRVPMRMDSLRFPQDARSSLRTA